MNVLNFQKQKFLKQAQNMTVEQQRKLVFELILKFNDRKTANFIAQKELNDIEFAEFKRVIKEKIG